MYNDRSMRRLIAITLWLVVAACESSSTAAHPSPSPTIAPTPVAGGCGTTQVYKGGQPDWLTLAGANNNPNDLPYFITTPPIAAGFIFGYPLTAGSRTTGSNKILWVVNRPRDGNDLTVSGHPLNAASPITRDAFPDNSGPGEIYPSEVDVPSPGCWHFDLAWGQNETAADLLYA